MSTEDAITQAQMVALTRLVRIAHESPDDHQARLAAEAIFKLRPMTSAAPSATPAAAATTSQPEPATPPRSTTTTTAAPSESPLTADELAQLQRLLPHVRPERFIRKHRPSHWRQVLAQLQPAPLRRTG